MGLSFHSDILPLRLLALDFIQRLWANCPACIRYFGCLPEQTLDSNYPINQQFSNIFMQSANVCTVLIQWKPDPSDMSLQGEDEDMRVYGNERWVLVRWGQCDASPWPGLSFSKIKDRQEPKPHLGSIQITRLCHRLDESFDTCFKVLKIAPKLSIQSLFTFARRLEYFFTNIYLPRRF